MSRDQATALTQITAAITTPREAGRGVVGDFLVGAGDTRALIDAATWPTRETTRDFAQEGLSIRASGAIVTAGSTAVGLCDLVAGRFDDAVGAQAEPWRHWRGRFALVRDEGRGALFAATDHFGTLPLYYTFDAERVLVATDLRLLLHAPWLRREADPTAIFHYLNFSYVPAPLTLVDGIHRLPPGSVLRWRTGRAEVKRYWRPAYAEDLDGSEEDLARQLRDRLVAGVQRYRPEDDAPWGCFLSGGTDSSSITSILARQHADRRVHSFSIGFAEAGYDELGFAEIAAKACGAEPHLGTIDETETLDVLPRLAELYDQPFGNASAVPTRACAALAARGGFSTLIAGDGGDEIFGGNERYAKDQIMQRFYRLPRPFKATVRGVAGLLGGGSVRFFNRVDNFARRASLPNPDRFYTDDSFGSDHYRDLLTPAFAARVPSTASLEFMRGVYGESGARSELHRIMALDLALAIAQNDLVKVHRACRDAGISARFPLLDPDLVDFTGRLGARWKVRGTEKRYLFKRAVAEILPASILSKPKQGFGLPISVWMAERPAFRDWIRDVLLSSRARQRGWFDATCIERLLDAHTRRAWDYSAGLWQLVVLELWLRRYLDA